MEKPRNSNNSLTKIQKNRISTTSSTTIKYPKTEGYDNFLLHGFTGDENQEKIENSLYEPIEIPKVPSSKLHRRNTTINPITDNQREISGGEIGTIKPIMKRSSMNNTKSTVRRKQSVAFGTFTASGSPRREIKSQRSTYCPNYSYEFNYKSKRELRLLKDSVVSMINQWESKAQENSEPTTNTTPGFPRNLESIIGSSSQNLNSKKEETSIKNEYSQKNLEKTIEKEMDRINISKRRLRPISEISFDFQSTWKDKNRSRGGIGKFFCLSCLGGGSEKRNKEKQKYKSTKQIFK